MGLGTWGISGEGYGSSFELTARATLRAAVRLPIVAIGGIDVPRADAVLAAGADAVAMIGALETAPDPASLVRRWRIP